MDKIQITLSQKEVNEIVAILEEAPYKKVKHLIHVLTQLSENRQNENQKLNIGDRVRARWLKRSTWYNGTINDFKKDQYFIKYDDGDEEWTTEEFIELLDKPEKADIETELQVGDRVQALWKGGETWYDGAIDKIKGSKYFIKYDDGDEEWTTKEFIKKSE